MSVWNPQHLYNLAWSFANIQCFDAPLFAAISASAVRIISDFSDSALSITVWSFANLRVKHIPLINAIASQAMPLQNEFSVQSFANTVWSFA